MIHQHQRRAYSDSPFARIHHFYTAGSRKGLKRRGNGGYAQRKKLTLRIIYFFALEEYVRDVKQDQKYALDLVESIIRPTDHVKEELRKTLKKMNRFRPEITKIEVSTF